MKISCYVKCVVYKTGDSINDYFCLDVISDNAHDFSMDDWVRQCVTEELDSLVLSLLNGRRGSLWSVFLKINLAPFVHQTEHGDEHDVDFTLKHSRVNAPKSFSELRYLYECYIKPAIDKSNKIITKTDLGSE